VGLGPVSEMDRAIQVGEFLVSKSYALKQIDRRTTLVRGGRIGLTGDPNDGRLTASVNEI